MAWFSLDKEKSIFPPVCEWINLALPFFFIAWATVFRLIGHVPDESEKVLFNNLANFIFLDVTHTGFTLLILGLLPEPRRVVAEAAQSYKPWLILALALMLAVPLLIAAQNGAFAFDPTWGRFALAVLTALFAQHSMAQVFGLSLLYDRRTNSRTHLSEANRQTLHDLQSRERRLFKLQIYLIIGSTILFGLVPEMMATWGPVYGFVTIAVLGSLLWGSFKQNRISHSHKFVYQLRIVLWSMSVFDPIIALGGAAFHAIEYMFVTHKMFLTSRLKKTAAFILVVTFVALVAYPLFRVYFADHVPYAWLLLAAGFSKSFDFLHYYLDGVIFRFKDPVFRQAIGPLLDP